MTVQASHTFKKNQTCFLSVEYSQLQPILNPVVFCEILMTVPWFDWGVLPVHSPVPLDVWFEFGHRWWTQWLESLPMFSFLGLEQRLFCALVQDFQVLFVLWSDDDDDDVSDNFMHHKNYHTFHRNPRYPTAKANSHQKYGFNKG